ncbi:type II toxin-antitoxin system Phd/YefM family antitoxin [Gallaecimonas pentaromativorans]|uniref:type II toxin-antitoxin system Phd/YefM family antitoxin n=1 Tax=Gallaecimonas pentaromativorans TaxID=584787 RepID=UPI0009F9F319|nr:type II toxin-antitoxin system Phd/YefM family antitoxin [Gallaecimonas pentaromativorans]
MNQHLVTKSYFKAHALALFRQVETTGVSLVVTDRGKPTIEVRAYHADKRTPLERLRGSVVAYTGPTDPLVDAGDWEVLP